MVINKIKTYVKKGVVFNKKNPARTKVLDLKTEATTEIELLLDKKGYLNAGRPGFNRLFGRDSLIASWQLLNWDSNIAKATLEILSELQGDKIDLMREEEPGKIIHETDFNYHEHPRVPGFPFPYYGSVDSTPLYLILFGFYYRKTHDEKFLDKHWVNILSAVTWMEKYGDKDQDSFLEYTQNNKKALSNQCWKDSGEYAITNPVAVVEVQGYKYLALKEVSYLAKTRGDVVFAERLENSAKKLKTAFNEKFWMEKEGFFALALDGNKKQHKPIASNAGHLLFTGIIDDNKVDLVVKRLFKKDLFTSRGIRTHSSLEPDFNYESYQLGAVWPHDNWIIAQGLKKLGYKKEYQQLREAIMKAHDEIGFLPEFYRIKDDKISLKSMNPNFPVVPCYPQAWASGTLLNFVNEK